MLNTFCCRPYVVQLFGGIKNLLNYQMLVCYKQNKNKKNSRHKKLLVYEAKTSRKRRVYGFSINPSIYFVYNQLQDINVNMQIICIQ